MKDSLIDLNEHLFAQIERLGDETIDDDTITLEIERAKAVAGIADRIINNASLVLKARELASGQRLAGGTKTDHLLALGDKQSV